MVESHRSSGEGIDFSSDLQYNVYARTKPTPQARSEPETLTEQQERVGGRILQKYRTRPPLLGVAGVLFRRAGSGV